jgi:hypothetical protein
LQAVPNFFTPPRLEPLHLDVVSLSGGGVSPAQFYGQTSDGRNIYCRYRGGWLSVHLSLEPGGDAYVEGTTLLEANIGPGLHGGLSVGQLCRYAGITVAGQLPPMPNESEIAEDRLLDLGGDMTFLDLMVQSTEDTALQLYDSIVNQIPDIIGAQQVQNSQGRYSICRTGADASDWRLSLLRPVVPLRGWPVEIIDIEDIGFRLVFGIIQHGAYRPPFRTMRYRLDERLAAAAGYPIHMVGAAGDLPVDNLWLFLSFPTSDEHGRKLATDVHRIVIERYPIERILAYDLSTQTRIPEKDYAKLLDQKILEWVKGDTGRWLVAYPERYGDSVRYVGFRPE